MIEIYADPGAQNTTIENIAAHSPGEVNGVIRVSFEDAKNMMLDMLHSASNEISLNQRKELLILADEIIIQNFLNLADGACMSCQSGSGYTDERCAHCRVYEDVKRCYDVTASELFSQRMLN